jgi:hypothetical protein
MNTQKQGRKSPSKRRKPLVSRATVKTYRDRGYDIYDTDGKLDADKIDAIHAEQQIKGKEGTSRSETAQH